MITEIINNINKKNVAIFNLLGFLVDVSVACIKNINPRINKITEVRYNVFITNSETILLLC